MATAAAPLQQDLSLVPRHSYLSHGLASDFRWSRASQLPFRGDGGGGGGRRRRRRRSRRAARKLPLPLPLPPFPSSSSSSSSPSPFFLQSHAFQQSHILRHPPHSSTMRVIQSSLASSLEDSSCIEAFDGLGNSHEPVVVCETRTLPPSLTLIDARSALTSAIRQLQSELPPLPSGIVRIQAPLAPDLRALDWLWSQPLCPLLLPRIYFSSRNNDFEEGDGSEHYAKNELRVAGVGSAIIFKGAEAFSLSDWRSIRRFLSNDCPLIRAYGGIRFNGDIKPAFEWESFGSFYFFIPQVEFTESSGCSLLSVTVAWDESLDWEFVYAINGAIKALNMISDQLVVAALRSLPSVSQKEHVPREQIWHDEVRNVLENLELCEQTNSFLSDSRFMESSFLEETNLSKVVMARRTTLQLDSVLEPLSLLSSLQGNDPNAYQFFIQTPDKKAFLGNTPERLFCRNALTVTSEAVAATASYGTNSKKDLQSSINLLLSTKDHLEFKIVRESIKHHMEMVCKSVEVVGLGKRLIKQANVQHLKASLVGELYDEADEFKLLSVLHPTPAVCGNPQEFAKSFIRDKETFDRGMYAGPVGWFGGDGAEFAVGIRSALVEEMGSAQVGIEVKGARLHLYAGVGIVKGSKYSSEWRELDLKIKQFEVLLQPSSPLKTLVNINALWARLIVDECYRLGVTYFCIAPGSRSSPLAIAASENSRIICISCIDERSLAFHALGYGRGARKPAAVITSSGTAVSNLLPAVVEASQDCVPLLLLTADRPPELQDTGANQTIDQVKQFGTFVRYHVNLPCADDKIEGRTILTTLDAAVYRASSVPCGPVHVNVPFREPLAGISEKWNTDCLRGLEVWESGAYPYTKYVSNCYTPSCLMPGSANNQFQEVVGILNSAEKGILVVGALHTAEDIWATKLLADFLQWPVMPDILSGIRLQKGRSLWGNRNDSFYMLNSFDHLLLSIDAQKSISPDVILQVGSRLTSSRVSKYMEKCGASAFILVEEHPYRHDPLHIVTHRVQSSIVEFTAAIKTYVCPIQTSNFSRQLWLLSNVVRQELSFQLQAEGSLTEPLTASMVANSAVSSGSALFLGNSMPIRDANMFAEALDGEKPVCSMMYSELGIQVAGNRGASGIDGVLSTAIGFAAGRKQRVTLLIGDISFLHDTNGLTLLANRRIGMPPITVVVVNNSGGGIFSLLPIAETVPAATFRKFFSTTHDISFEQLCQAHKINHMTVQTKQELKEALSFVQNQEFNWVVEVASNIEDNADFHRCLQSASIQAVNHALQLLSSSGNTLGSLIIGGTIQHVSYFQYRFLLCSETTTGVAKDSEVYRDGFLLKIDLGNGHYGFGEIAPLEGLHKESLIDAEEQIRFLAQYLIGLRLNTMLALLNGSFSEWLSRDVGIKPRSIFPSVRCGLEMAILGALASISGHAIADLLDGSFNARQGEMVEENEASAKGKYRKVRICALIESNGTPEEVAKIAFDRVKQGFCTLKLKVARRASPLEDAIVLLAVREKVGPTIHLRVDANQRWNCSQAIEFANATRSCGLQYIEEPVSIPEEISRFYKETSLPVALDETIDKYSNDFIQDFVNFSHPGIVALVIKPSCVGGFEHAAMIAKWAQKQGMVAVISSAFESSIGLAAYTQLAACVDRKRLDSIASSHTDRRQLNHHNIIPTVSHGLGTYEWLKQDVIKNGKFCVEYAGDRVEACVNNAATLLRDVKLNENTTILKASENTIDSKTVCITHHGCQYAFHVLDTGEASTATKGPVLVFLHGFLGLANDWVPIMHALSVSFRCIAVDLPGHGETKISDSIRKEGGNHNNAMSDKTLENWSMKNISQALSKLLQLTTQREVILVGYSMGARLTLYMALRCNRQVSAAVVVSGSPGLQNPEAQEQRAKKDKALAHYLQVKGLQSFVDMWYERSMWESLRKHPRFEIMKRARLKHTDVDGLSRILATLSVGQQPSLWEDLAQNSRPLLFVVGQKDTKFLRIARKICGREADEKPQKPWADKDAFPDMVFPSFEEIMEKLPDDPSFREFVANEMQKFQLEETLSLQLDRHVEKERDTSSKLHDLYVIEDTGHAIHIENPLQLINIIHNFALGLRGESSLP